MTRYSGEPLKVHSSSSSELASMRWNLSRMGMWAGWDPVMVRVCGWMDGFGGAVLIWM